MGLLVKDTVTIFSPSSNETLPIHDAFDRQDHGASGEGTTNHVPSSQRTSYPKEAFSGGGV